jgi:pentatricopeptide repeat protein
LKVVNLERWCFFLVICQEEAMAWFERMHEAGCVPDGVTYSTMLDVYGRMGKYDEAIALYKNLRKAAWKPDKVTYGTMVRLFGRAGYLRAALTTFQEMKASGVQADSIVYNILISCLGRAGRMGHALRIFEEMEQAGVKPNAVTLSTVMETYNRSGNVADGLEVFSRLRKGVICDVIVYNTVIKMCGDAGLVTEADRYFREMGEAGCQPNDWTYRNMISMYAKQGMAVEAQRMFTSLVEAGYPADVMAYTCLLQAYGNAKEYKKVEEILNEMGEANCAPDERLCCVVLNLLNSCDRDEDMELIRSCLRRCNPVLDNLVGELFEEKMVLEEIQRELQSLLKEIAEDAHKPICNSLVQLGWGKGNRNHVFQLLPVLHLLGVYPGLQSKSSTMWSLHLRSLSTGAAHCALLNWLSSLRYAIQERQELPSRIIIETGVGRQVNGDELRLIVVISSVLKDMSSPFEECADRQDWLEASGADVRQWLETVTLDLPPVSN